MVIGSGLGTKDEAPLHKGGRRNGRIRHAGSSRAETTLIVLRRTLNYGRNEA
jgi:hypothetical protein